MNHRTLLSNIYASTSMEIMMMMKVKIVSMLMTKMMMIKMLTAALMVMLKAVMNRIAKTLITLSLLDCNVFNLIYFD